MSMSRASVVPIDMIEGRVGVSVVRGVSFLLQQICQADKNLFYSHACSVVCMCESCCVGNGNL